MVPPVASKSTTEMISKITLAVTTMSGPLILHAEFVVNTLLAHPQGSHDSQAKSSQHSTTGPRFHAWPVTPV